MCIRDSNKVARIRWFESRIGGWPASPTCHASLAVPKLRCAARTKEKGSPRSSLRRSKLYKTVEAVNEIPATARSTCGVPWPKYIRADPVGIDNEEVFKKLSIAYFIRAPLSASFRSVSYTHLGARRNRLGGLEHRFSWAWLVVSRSSMAKKRCELILYDGWW